MVLLQSLQNSKEENLELIGELDPNDTGRVDWLVWVTELLTVCGHSWVLIPTPARTKQDNGLTMSV